MRALALLGLLLVPALLAGCTAPAADGAPEAPAARGTDAPWWPVGAWWEVTVTRGAGAPVTHRMVHFWNDSATDHFWLGVQARDVAMDQALRSSNPFLGRIHHGYLAPHEAGVHAMMYRFPLQAGDVWGSQGTLLGREWNFRSQDVGGRHSVVGVAADGARITFDYDPETQWFRTLEIVGPGGRRELHAEVAGHGTDARGNYVFLRGRDYYEGPKGSGTREETFEVKREERPHHSLALVLDVGFSGPMRLEVVDPAGAVRHAETFTGGRATRVLEIPEPATGTWTMRYLGQGNADGRVRAVGILEYAGRV